MNNKKIALVTCYFQPNYGSQLQAYATQLLFDKLGIENETICIDGLQAEINRAKYRYFLSKLFDKNIWIDKISAFRKIFITATKGQDFVNNLQLRDKMFREFAHSMFRVSTQYKSKKELEEAAHHYKAFIVGSDQLWLPSNIEADYYTLNFVPDDICKLAFATSFGVSTLPHKQAKKASAFLKRLNYISVREHSATKIIKGLTGKDVPVVCDPTLMFTAQEWSAILPQKRFLEEPYIFCYFLGNNPEQREFVKRVREYTGIKIVQLQYWNDYTSTNINFPDYAPYNVGPKEFVQLIRDAEYIFTDSFHCSVFSMLFEKKFFTFKRYSKDSKISTNGRIYSLLSLVHQEQRLLNANEDVKTIINQEINYKIVNSELSKLRQFSYDWLNSCFIQSGILK